MRQYRKIWSIVGLTAALVAAGWVLGLRPAAGLDEFASIRDGLLIYKAVLDNVVKYYVDRDKVDVEKIIKQSIDGLLEKLDPYTKYLPQSDYENLSNQTKGEYGGLGISIWVLDKVLTVREVFDGTPAANVGIQAGDRITKIEGTPTRGITLDEAVGKMRGQPGTEVTITVDREGFAQPLEYSVVRDIIKMPSVAFTDTVRNGVGYVRVTSFSKETSRELKEALQRLLDRGMQGLVLDLRGNPGGLLQQAVEVSDLFLPKDAMIVYTRGRLENQNQEYRAQDDIFIGDRPLVVLVDRGSASASEIVSGAIQDWDRGLILGTITWGKGLVQTVLPVGKGTSALKITTAKYYTPSGRCIQRDHEGRGGDENHEEDDSLSVPSLEGPAVAADTALPREEFKTNAGRIMFGGGGITPDITVGYDTIPKIELDLLRQNLFFKFAVHYVTQQKLKLAAYPDLVVDDAVLHVFRDYLREQKFDYQSEMEQEFTRFTELAAKRAVDYPALSGQLDGIKATLAQDDERDFQRHLARIRHRVKMEMASRLWGNEGRIRASLEHDRQLERAVTILADRKQYRELLNATPAKGAKHK